MGNSKDRENGKPTRNSKAASFEESGMEGLIEKKEWTEIVKNVRRVVNSLEICWKCQHVAECNKYVLGQTVLVWLCKTCLGEMETSGASGRPKTRIRAPEPKLSSRWGGF